ncbi:class I SAM-dependent methyltransferase [Deminuibacter soli]|uniref:site-specific DNA-methyltransferase (cytosine-N(4)-specific) n=1 Tax=Deminuibacter soli TaxID=2291815 RepID=A0A3E1NGR3_9BACT|nr:DNA methyltransferase [Deminuibacter soli]RFM27139.1 hypothetical protein DXN05_16905 [Deminuibacter soli]
MEIIEKVPKIKRVYSGHDAPAFLPENIDEKICNEIDALTEENNTFWSSPDHDRSEYLHSFFQYPAMMVPIVQKKLIEIIIRNQPETLNVLDPYMGSGTSLVACMENGLNCYGQDINPLAILVTKTRTGPYYVKAIKERKEEFFGRFDNDRSNKIEANFKGLKKWFKDSVSIELSKIARAIREEDRPAIRRFYWVILAEVVRLTSNDRTSTFKLHIREAKEIENRNISPIRVFKSHFENCIEDLNWYSDLLLKADKLSKGAYIGEVTLKLCDSKEKIYTPTGEGNFFDLLVTSPPYGDNKTTVTYGQHSYLPLQWIDLSDIHELATNDFLKTTSEIDTRGLGGKLKRIEDDKLEILFSISPSFHSTYLKLKLASPDKLKKVVNFIYDLYLSIVNIHSSLKINSYQIWTVGNRNVGGVEIPNDKIIKELIENEGAILIKKISREILHRRMAKRNKDAELMTFEDILIFRKIA